MSTVTIPQALEMALQHHEAGRLREAEFIYRQILQVQPGHGEALHLLGLIAHQCGRDEAAVELIQRAILHGFDGAVPHSNLAEAYRALGRLDEALAACRKALNRNAESKAARMNLGIILRARGDWEEAMATFRRVIEKAPRDALAQSHLAECLAEQNRLGEAEEAYRATIRLEPDWAEPYSKLGLTLSRQGRWDEATRAYRHAVRMKPDLVEAHHNLGVALSDQGKYAEACATLHRVLELQPSHAEAHYNLGNALRALGKTDEAIDAYRRAVELRPDYAAALNNLGNAYRAQGRLPEALDAFRRAAECKDAEAGMQSNLITTMLYVPGVTDGEVAAEQARWNARFAKPADESATAHGNSRDPKRRLRIGYVSPDLRDHTLGRNLLPLIREHDRRDFEVICYAEVAHPDDRTEDFRRHANRWRSTVGFSDAELMRMIRDDAVDILVDLALHTAGNRLPVFAQRPAPVQVSFAGYPGSAGANGIGWRLSDPYLESASGARAGDVLAGDRERVFLIDSFWCYDPCGMDVPVSPLPAKAAGRVMFGSLNAFSKINAPVLKLWARVLREVADSRLILLSPEGSHRDDVIRIVEDAGVAGERCEFVAPLPRREYLELYRRVDIMLDPFPYGGHTTSLDALWMGVPVVTLPGQSIVSRAGLSQLSNLGLAEWVARSEEEYVRIAAGWARDEEQLAELRATLRPRMESSLLMDGPRFARGIERAFRAMWRQWCASEGKA